MKMGNTGITLITLVITIILMIILAGISIDITLKDNGIINRAIEAKNKIDRSSIIEQIKIEIICKQIEKEEENISKEDLEQILGKYGEVQKDENGKLIGVITDKGGYNIVLQDILDEGKVKESGNESEEKKIAIIILNRKTLTIEEGKKEILTVTIEPEDAENKELEWESNKEEIVKVDNKGELVALKEGTAIVTVSSKNDKTINDKCTITVTKAKGAQGESGYLGEQYNDPYIPIGFRHTEGTWNSGYTIIGETESVGNEFVWVPCVLTTAEQEQAKSNGDSVQIFQEIKTGKYMSSTISLISNASDKIKNSVGKYQGFYIAKYEAGIPGTTKSVTIDHNTSVSGNILPVSKPNVGVWNFISKTNALSLSNKMINYEKTGVHSTLINGTAWDTTLKWITNTADSNYAENSKNKGNNSGAIAVTSSNLNKYYSKNNIYDMAGNISEWTDEACIIKEGKGKCVLRGGNYEIDGTEYPAALRYPYDDKEVYNTGFRPVIYK